jgi:hypothetical protein
VIYLNFNLRNPFSRSYYANIKCWHGETFIKNKFWEVQVIKCDNWLRIEFELSVRQDHAGMNLELGLFHYEIHFTIYDNRHWDYINNTWETYEESSSKTNN